MAVAALGVNSRALWYLTRGTGLVALVLLTVTMVLGITQVVRYARPGLARFVIAGLHKNASLLAVVFLGVHIVTAVADTFAPIRIVDVFVPFVGTYRPLWLGLGAVSFDLMIALIVTSLVRERIGLRVWKAIHWAAYASWPVALAHGLGTGTDTKLSWVLFVYIVCLVAVGAAVVWRLGTDWTVVNTKPRLWAGVASAAVIVAVSGWTVAGPLRPGWAKTAGTPTKLLGGGGTIPAQSPTAPASSPPSSTTPQSTGGFPAPFADRFTGTLTQAGPAGDGNISVTISGSLTGPAAGQLVVILLGSPAGGGGIALRRGSVSVGPNSQPRQYQGSVAQLSGQQILARVSDTNGHQMSLTIDLNLSGQTTTVTGTVQGTV
ncbi:MAG: ferric reductase-like transmembrane domain-containing protein [Actinomycetota bacterium]|nr:ferric reductase-like transmembrane domain-containing protein [Actinomycetota bacterium]